MGEFRDAMVGEMRLRGFALRTQRTYSSWMSRLVLRVKVAADRITEQQVGFGDSLSACAPASAGDADARRGVSAIGRGAEFERTHALRANMAETPYPRLIRVQGGEMRPLGSSP